MQRPRVGQTFAPPVSAGSAEVRELRKGVGLSQSGFARALNVSTELVQAWEAGRRIPQGAALRLLALGRQYPELVFSQPVAELREQVRDQVRDQAREPVRGGPTRTSPSVSPLAARSERHRQFDALLTHLNAHGVKFIVIGGVAAQLRGSNLITDDLDVLYDRSPDNLERLATALRTLTPTLRGAPGSIPFPADTRTLAHSTSLALDTRFGPLDLRQRVSGVGDFATARSARLTAAVPGTDLTALTVDALIASKRATGRSRDRDQIAALEALKS